MEKNTMTQTNEIQPQAHVGEGKRKRKHGAHIQFFIDPPLYRRMQDRARSEGLTAVSWIRRAAIKELRRKAL
jgi:hypothetical protein